MFNIRKKTKYNSQWLTGLFLFASFLLHTQVEADLAANPILCIGDGYKITSASNGPPVYKIDPTTNPPALSLFFNADSSLKKTTTLGYSLKHGLLYVVDQNDSRKLKSINNAGTVNTVNVTGFTGSLGTVVFDVSYDGIIYARNGNSRDKLVKLQLNAAGTSAAYLGTLDFDQNTGSDIAIHPFNSNIYTKTRSNILVFDANNTSANASPIKTYSSGVSNFNSGSQFFDGLGRLYAWSNETSGTFNNALVRYTFNSDGSVTEENLGNTGINGTGDGAGCPASLNLVKTTNVTDANPGDVITYGFDIENGYQTTIVFTLNDTLPAGFQVQGSPRYLGDITGSQNVTLGTGDPQTINITGISVAGTQATPQGAKTGTIEIDVKIPEVTSGGSAQNQATLSGFPDIFGPPLLSDNNSTNPKQPTTVTVTASPKLTLVKKVVNDGSGSNTATDWTLTATATNTASTISGATGSAAVTGVYVAADSYDLSESGPAGYNLNLSCSNATGGGTDVSGVSATLPNLTLANADDVTCTFTNNDVVADVDLSVTKTLVSTGPFTTGDTITYTIVVNNPTSSSAVATNVQVKDLPTNLSDIRIISATSCTPEPVTAGVICTIASLAPGATETITLTAKVP